MNFSLYSGLDCKRRVVVLLFPILLPLAVAHSILTNVSKKENQNGVLLERHSQFLTTFLAGSQELAKKGIQHSCICT